MEFCYGYPGFSYADESINVLNIPENCMNVLKRTGIEYIGDLLDVYARYRLDPMSISGFSVKCISPIFRELITIDGCPWRDEIEEWLVKWVEK